MKVKENLDRVAFLAIGLFIIVALILMWMWIISSFSLGIEDVIFWGTWTAFIGLFGSAFVCYGILGYVPITH
jgi:hypothetical protein